MHTPTVRLSVCLSLYVKHTVWKENSGCLCISSMTGRRATDKESDKKAGERQAGKPWQTELELQAAR